jgi:hypothetical protein
MFMRDPVGSTLSGVRKEGTAAQMAWQTGQRQGPLPRSAAQAPVKPPHCLIDFARKQRILQPMRVFS